jgi:hypothetical protein
MEYYSTNYGKSMEYYSTNYGEFMEFISITCVIQELKGKWFDFFASCGDYS